LTSRLGGAALEELDGQARARRFRLLFRLPPSESQLERHDAVYQMPTEAGMVAVKGRVYVSPNYLCFASDGTPAPAPLTRVDGRMRCLG
jgi:hypothetical protein